MLKFILLAFSFFIANSVFAAHNAEQGSVSPKKSMAQIEANHIQIGQKICRSVGDVTMQKQTGYFGGDHYLPYVGKAELVGFVENFSGNKIQIRISGMTFVGRLDTPPPYDPEIREPMNNFNSYKGSNIQIGSVIWDDYSDWPSC